MKVLIVDDQLVNLLLLDTLLKGYGYEVDQASNGKEALELLRANSYQLIISDILMPVMDGYELCQICKADPHLKNIIFVFYTATYTTKEDEEYAMQLGADKFLIKPMEPSAFMNAIHEITKSAEINQIPLKEPAITDFEALKKHRDRLLNKLSNKIDELELEIKEKKGTEEQYQRLMDLSPGPIIIHCDWEIIYANNAGYHLLDEDNLIGRQVFDFIHPDYHDIVKERIQKLMTGNAPVPTKEEKYISATGKIIDVEVTSLPAIFEGKHAIQSLIHDITEKKKANEALKQSEKKYRELFDGMNETVWIIDFNGNLVDVNKTAVEVLGYSKKELLSIGLPGIDTSISKEDIIAMAKSMPSEKHQIFETTHKTKDGRAFPVEVFSSLVSYHDQQFILSIARDITERKNSEAALEKERNLLRTLIDNLPSGIFVKDRDYRKIITNPVHTKTVRDHLKYLGIKEEIDILNKTDFEVFPKNLADSFFKEDQKVIEGGESIINNEELGVQPDGNDIWLLVSKVPLYDKDGSIIGMVGITNDFTESKRTHEEIQKNLEEKEILLRELYHRTKNNMQVISSMLRLHAQLFKDEESKRVLYSIDSKIMSMALVHQKLYESKDLSHLNLLEYCNEIVALIRKSYLNTASQVAFKVTGDDSKILIDTAIPFGLVLNELITNSLKYAFIQNEQAEISITFYTNESNERVIEIADNGMGLPPDFDLTKDSGLGLQTVVALVEHQLKGKIEFINQKGLLCRIVLKDELYTARV